MSEVGTTVPPPAVAQPGRLPGWPRVAIWAGRAALLGGGAAVAVRIQADPEALADEWDTMVSRLGIAPVFPPEEDLRVGDLYAVLGDDLQARGKPNRLEIRFGRAVKLDHLATVDDKLVEFYSRIVVFPPTLAPQPPPAFWQQPDCSGPCFEATQARHQLPLVLFPGFTLSHKSGGEVNGGLFGRLFHAAAQEGENADVRIPVAESYGIPSLVASGLLRGYCEQPGRADACSEDAVRSQLSTVFRQVLERATAATYRYSVRLVLVSRVYLTRSLSYTFAAESAAGSDLRLPGASAKQPADAAPEKSPGQAQAERNDTNHIFVDQTLPRPVAIGFNAVENNFHPDVRVAAGSVNVAEPE